MGRLRTRDWAPGAALVALTALLLGPALGPLVVGGVRAALADGLGPARGVGVTLATAVGIGLLSVGFAWAPARVLARRRGFAAVVLVPVLMPPYLVFAGYGMVRDPGWWVGSVLTEIAADGSPWVTRWVGYGLAIAGLALWAFPIAALVLASGLRAQGREVDDMLRLDAGPLRRGVTRVRMNLGGVAAATGLVALVMLGSAVPLHLAQIETMAIDLWRRLNESGVDEWSGVWAAGWPLMMVAVAGAVWTAWWVERRARAVDQGEGGGSVSGGVQATAWGVWALAALGPIVLFVMSLRSAGSLGEFWRLSGPGVAAAVGFGLADAAVVLVVAAVAAMVAGASTGRKTVPQWVVRAVLAAWVFAAVVPGVFVGGALARAGAALPRGSGDGLVVLAHVTRFGAVGVIAGLVAGWSEPRERRELRALDDATGLVGWARACLPWQWPTLVGGALAVGFLGMHEIEATVLLLVPGRANLAQQILGYLHFSRTEELSAAASILMAGGLVMAGAASWLIIRRNRAS